MERNPTFVPVVAAVIRDEKGRLLLQQCPPHKRHAGKWEFPGGKVENGETPRVSLRREVTEELGLALDCGAMEPAGFADESARDGRPALVLLLYNCPVWCGQPASLEGQPWAWFTREEATALDMPAMDRALLANLS